MKTNTYLAADFGGGSGRIIAGTIRDGQLRLEEIHRFTNRLVQLGDRIYWDFPALFQELKEGLRKAARTGLHIAGIGVDTWGVDFGLIDRNGHLLGNPVSYRDPRTAGQPEKLFARISPQEHYRRNGIQVMPINTLFQLTSMVEEGDPRLEAAHRLLFMPDLFNYYLTGVAANEYSIATTSEMLCAGTRNWDTPLLDQLGIPARLFGDITLPGTPLGPLRDDIARETGLGPVPVITVGSHDTASAIAAVPATGNRWAYLSSGTWSLLGVETPNPILTEEARQAQFTNEGGVGGNITFLRNITGLWILQRLVAEWEQDGTRIDYNQLIPQAAQVAENIIIDVDDPVFQQPDGMSRTLQQYCRDHNLPVPDSQARFVKCVCASLAAKYKEAIDQMNPLLPAPVEQLHIIGGGSRNQLLNQLTADATRLTVVAGPAEATAIGNILIQARATGDITTDEELKNIVTRSFETQIGQPR
ncbi:MAG: rhamnulokinase [Coprobacter sp.]|nr:rhamnulokinase [Coprobacter sp.]